MPEERPSLFELVLGLKNLDDRCAAGHNRHNELLKEIGLRLDALEARVEELSRSAESQGQTISTLERRKVEVGNIRFSWTMLVSAIMFTAALVGGQKWSTSGIARQLDDQSGSLALLSEKFNSMKQHEEDVTKLQEERAANVQRQITQISGQVTMIDTKLSNFRETLAARR